MTYRDRDPSTWTPYQRWLEDSSSTNGEIMNESPKVGCGCFIWGIIILIVIVALL